MSKLLKSFSVTAAILVAPSLAFAAGDAAKGEKTFKKCAACHAVGDSAKNKVGPQLNELIGRTAGGLDDYKYSNAMLAAGADGLVWNAETIGTYLAKPKDMIKGTKMAFAGLKKDDEIENVVAYLATFSDAAPEAATSTAEPPTVAVAAAAPAQTLSSNTRQGGVFGLGRVATTEEIAAWDIDVRPDGTGLPQGSGSVADGEVLYTDNCAVCHGDFGEGVGRWPVLAGGQDTLKKERPEKTIGSYWPYLSTVYDYVRRAMPYGNARSLSDDDVYALTAYLLYLNDVVTDEEFVLSQDNFTNIHLPNEANFIADTRAEESHYASGAEPCMANCKDGAVEITMRARILDVTPGTVDDDDATSGVGGVD